MEIPKKEQEARLAALRETFSKKREGIYLTDREDVYYFSGFTGDSSALLITPRRQFLITDPRFTEEANQSAPGFEVLLWKKHPAEFAGKLARRLRLEVLGYLATKMNVASFRMLRKNAVGITLVDRGEKVAQIRARKSAWEIRRIEASLRCAEAAMEAVRSRIRPGISEQDLRLDLEWEMRRRGASEAAFEIIVAADGRASLPHAHAGEKKLRAGGMVLVDFGAKVGRYASDLTRVFFLGSIPPHWQKRYELVREAQKSAFSTLCPGIPAAEVDQASRAILIGAGYEYACRHATGHGLGLAVHEVPRLAKTSRDVLSQGMVVTVEPGIYFPRRGGIRIEDVAVLTDTGARWLSQLPNELSWAILE